MKVVRTKHFKDEQATDGITEDEIARAWTQHDEDVPSVDHPGARVRSAPQLDGSRVSVVGLQTTEQLLLITTWRNTK